MIKRERYYDGYGNELKIDEIDSETVKVSINKSEINVPLAKLMEMVATKGHVNGKHVKRLEVR